MFADLHPKAVFASRCSSDATDLDQDANSNCIAADANVIATGSQLLIYLAFLIECFRIAVAFLSHQAEGHGSRGDI
jgi:3D (Asp-Asp-Asp) domain-containing protein